MRLFLAVELDAAVRRNASTLITDLAKKLDRAGGRSVGWVKGDNLHVTVRFLGDVEEARTMALVDALREPVRVAPFDLDVNGVGAFPPVGPPRVIWLGISAGQDSLARIYADLEARVEALGFEPEDRPYRAHLTVGRVKSPLPGRPRDVLGEMGLRPVGRCHVERVTLFESRLSSRGPTYVPVTSVALKA